jgi:hypothetical protein
LNEACRLFRTYEEHEAASAIEDLLAEISFKRQKAASNENKD